MIPEWFVLLIVTLIIIGGVLWAIAQIWKG